MEIYADSLLIRILGKRDLLKALLHMLHEMMYKIRELNA